MGLYGQLSKKLLALGVRCPQLGDRNGAVWLLAGLDQADLDDTSRDNTASCKRSWSQGQLRGPSH